MHSAATAWQPWAWEARGDNGGMAHTWRFGGTFDPIHVGHVVTARAAREMLGAQRVLFVPARISPHKTGRDFTAGVDRVAMIELAIGGIAEFGVDARELAREG